MSKRIIVIGRQFGTGGHELGERVAKALNIPLYDKNLVELASKELGIAARDVELLDEEALSRFVTVYQAPWDTGRPYYLTEYNDSDNVFRAESAIIRKLAEKGPCVIVGRCADYVLRKRDDVLSVFVCAEMEDRIKRVMKVRNLTEKDAEAVIKKNDKNRRNYYKQHTERDWESTELRHLILNASLLDMDEMVEILKAAYRKRGIL